MNIAWDAAEYESNFSFVHQYGANVLDLVDEGHGGRYFLKRGVSLD